LGCAYSFFLLPDIVPNIINAIPIIDIMIASKMPVPLIDKYTGAPLQISAFS
jgi:hypothetical protein